MAIKIPERNFSTFPELMVKWGCTENDLITEIISRALKPSIRAHTKFQLLTWCEVGLGEFEEDFEVDGLPISNQPQSWLYLQDPIQIHPFDCEFSRASDERNPEKGAIPSRAAGEPNPTISEMPFGTWYKLPDPIRIENVKRDAIFMHTEVAAYESAHGANAVVAKIDRPLATIERNCLLSIIAVLCKEAKLDHTKHAKTAGLIQSMATSMGVSIGETTIEDHLKKIRNALETRMK